MKTKLLLICAGAVSCTLYSKEPKKTLDEQLMEAIEKRETGSFKRLLNAGASANAKNESDMTALILAINKDDEKIVKELIKNGADVNQFGGGITPLMAAAAKCNSNMVDLLLKKGADITIAAPSGATALSTAEAADECDRKETIRMLKSASQPKKSKKAESEIEL